MGNYEDRSQPLNNSVPEDRSIPAADDSRIDNAGSDPGNSLRRSGGSANDPHGGHENISSELGTPEPDPVRELVPGGQGAEAAPYAAGELTRGTATQQSIGAVAGDRDIIGDDATEQPAASLAYTDVQVPNVPTDDLSAPGTPDHVQGSGRLEEPVERRDNNLIFDAKTGNFAIKDEVHAAGATSQDKA